MPYVPYPAPTTGVGVASKITVDTQTITLSLSGTTTHQIVPTIKDAVGNTKSSIASFVYISSNPAFATVSPSGLITAVKKGESLIEVCYPVSDNSHGLHTNGTYLEKIYGEVIVKVTP